MGVQSPSLQSKVEQIIIIEKMDTRMAEYIMVILKSRLQIMWSWGCCKFTALNEGLMWHVEGFLLNGWVKVLYNYATDAFDVYFLNNHKEVVEKVEEVYLDNLVDVIDRHVEKTSDYEERVRAEYGITTS